MPSAIFFSTSSAFLQPPSGRSSLPWPGCRSAFAEIGLPLPWIGWEINYFFFFLLCYILARILFGRVKRKLPYFRGMHQTLLTYEKTDTGQK